MFLDFPPFRDDGSGCPLDLDNDQGQNVSKPPLNMPDVHTKCQKKCKTRHIGDVCMKTYDDQSAVNIWN